MICRAANIAIVSALIILAACAASCAPLPELQPLTVACTATDGDTIRCGDERIRLLGIDAPELPGHCRAGRECVEGDPVASKEALAAQLAKGQLTIRRFGLDRYGRTLAVVYAGGSNLSCAQLAVGVAIYVPEWDNGGAVQGDCTSG